MTDEGLILGIILTIADVALLAWAMPKGIEMIRTRRQWSDKSMQATDLASGLAIICLAIPALGLNLVIAWLFILGYH
jgi:hypothetical protein